MTQLIITDSTSYLSPAFCRQNNIEVVPLNVNLQGEIFREGVDKNNHDYFQMLRQLPVFPQTSQPSSGDFLRIFSQLQAGDEALVIVISAGISGTFQSALMARTMLNRADIKIEIVDSRFTSIGLAFQVMKACTLRDRGCTLESSKEALLNIQQQLSYFFVVDDLEYLARGGRIGHWSKHLGSILQIKPVLHLKDGKIEVFQKIRTRSKAINLIVEELSKRTDHVEKVAIAHVDAADLVPAIQEKVASIYNGPLEIHEVGPVIGSHVGPGTVGLCFY
ncbi:MAG: DegV family protein [Syntrophomonadaceae bacterium]|nr:DegV family protein [Syntrophomonadaceae bacterium]